MDEDEEQVKKDSKKDSEPTRLVSVKDIDKYITIGEYKGLALKKTVEAVTEEDVEAEIEYEMQNKAASCRVGSETR